MKEYKIKTINQLIAKHGTIDFMIGIGYVKNFVENNEKLIKIQENLLKKFDRLRVTKILNGHLDRIDGLTVSQSLDNALDEIYK